MKNPLKILIYSIIAAIAIYACRDEILDNDSNNIPLKIEEAKTWYESNHNDAVLLKSAEAETLPVTFYANWAEACQRKGKHCETVEVALMSTGKLSILAPETYQEYKATKNEKLKRSFTRLVVRSDKKSKKKNGFLMTIIPSLEYFKATNFHPFHSTYLDVDKDFSGLIIYHNLDGIFSNGWKYRNGEKTHSVTQVSGSDLNLKSGYYDCHIESYYEVYETCTEWHTWTEYGDRITDETCEYDYVLVEYEVCEWIEDPDDDDYTGGGTTSTAPTAEEVQELICDAYSGVVNMATIINNKEYYTSPQEQYIIGLANIAALYELGNSIEGIQQDLCNYSTSSGLYTKYNKLNNYESYIDAWEVTYNSSANSDTAYVSIEIGESGFQLKFYPEKNGEYNALGLVKASLGEHVIEAALEFLEYIDVKYAGFPDDYLYDMHLFNVLNFMNDYCDD